MVRGRSSSSPGLPTWRPPIGDKRRRLNLAAPAATQEKEDTEVVMSQWRDTMVDRPETDGAAYLTGWTISGAAVLGTVLAVWLFGI